MFLLFFGVAFTFSFFFSRFFLHFVTKIYFSALTVLLLTPSFPLFAYYFHSVSIVLLSQFKLTHARVHSIYNDWFSVLNQFYLFPLEILPRYLALLTCASTIATPCWAHSRDARTHSRTLTRRTAWLKTLLSQKLEITCRHAHARTPPDLIKNVH